MFTFFSAGAQTKFYASVTPENAGKDEYVKLTFTLENGDGPANLTLPSLKEFKVISGPNQMMSATSMNSSDIKRAIGYYYILQPKRSGKIHIGAATVAVKGKILKSEPLNLNVSNKPAEPDAQQNGGFFSGPAMDPDPLLSVPVEKDYHENFVRKGESIPDKIDHNIKLRLETNKTSCYVGEPLTATYKLYSRLRTESEVTKNASFNGFSVVDMTKQSDRGCTQENLNGKEYNTYMIRKAQLYPLQSGAYDLEAASVDNRITFIKSSGDYDDPTGVSENITLNSKPVTINVKPLPEEGKPANFKDAVGNFRIGAALEKNVFANDETGNLVIVISGSGNMHLLTAPEVKWPEKIDAFDAKTSDNTDNSTVPISGNKTFQIPFSVSLPGEYVIPEISFSFFDPASASYKTVATKPISFTVTKGTGKKKVDTVYSAPKEGGSFTDRIFGNRMIVIFLLAALIIGGIIFWLKKEEKRAVKDYVKSNPEAPVTETNYSFTEVNPLEKTEDCLNMTECAEFYSVLSTEFKAFISKKYHLPVEQLNTKTTGAAMDKAGVNNHAILQTQALMQEIDRLLYTPFVDNDQFHEMYAKAQTLIQVLNMHSA